ncbi:MAG: hypothetical protein RI556_04900 [Hydrogenovibrio sp.]|uniref:hypothetical protein n=1 Tax=Hydrogenovibrio sp. TaxID=2065821 RepID=UPI00287092CD|nr:hypothetical protein [Hydrogenovibrio sp.]MDR9498491.1 hypothetical protein [Hydrogenovibrio sp.]
MSEKRFSFFSGLSSCFQIWPSGSYQQYLPKGTVAERVNGHWVQVGSYFNQALVSYENERGQKKAVNHDAQ